MFIAVKFYNLLFKGLLPIKSLIVQTVFSELMAKEDKKYHTFVWINILDVNFFTQFIYYI
jgi:hypothetical protein